MIRFLVPRTLPWAGMLPPFWGEGTQRNFKCPASGRGDGGEGMACVVYDLPPHPGPPTQSGGEGVYVVAAPPR
jgi:hypothetical protein